MKAKKVWIFSLAAFVTVFSLSLHSNKIVETGDLTQTEIDQIDMEETYPAALGSLAVCYDNLDNIVDDADVIVYGTPQNSNVVNLEGFSQTHTIFTISEVIKGSLNINDEIEIIEEGGYKNTVAGGIPKLTASNSYVLFLLEYEGSYYVCGAFQGRFVEKSGYLFQQATEDVKLNRSAYTPIKAEDFINEIKAITEY